MRGIWHPTAQFPAEPLKTETSTTPVPFGQALPLELSAHIAASEILRRGDWFLCNGGASSSRHGPCSVPCVLLGPRCRGCRLDSGSRT